MNYWNNYEDKNILLCCLKLWTTRSRSGSWIKKGDWARLRTCLWKQVWFWSDSWWGKSFFQAETVQVSWARGSFKNHQEVNFNKEDTHLEMHDSFMIILTILWAKLSLNFFQYYFHGVYNGLEVWQLFLNNLTLFLGQV